VLIAGHPIEEVPDAAWDRIFAVNIGAAFALSRAVVAGIERAGSGRIINISSRASLGPSLTGMQGPRPRQSDARRDIRALLKLDPAVPINHNQPALL